MPALSSSQMSQLVLSSLDSESRNLIPREYPINIGFRFIECESLGLQSNMVAANGFLSVVASLPQIFTICSTIFP